MNAITAIRAQKRRRDRANIFVDGEYAFSLQKILAARLHVGDVLTPQEITDIRQKDAAEQSFDNALRYLGYRPRSSREVRQHMKKRGLDEETIERVVERLSSANLLDDRAFAEWWVENRETFRPRGAWALRAELRQKGIANAVIEEVLSDLDQDSSALRAAQRRARRYAHLSRSDFLKKMLGFLQRRGFSYSVARPATEAVMLETLGPENDDGYEPEDRSLSE